MTIRNSMMATLIARVRRMIGDCETPLQFDDDALQSLLDETLVVEVDDATATDFDAYAAGATACEEWAAQLIRAVDFKDGEREFKDSQSSANLLKLADRLRAQARTAPADADDSITVGRLLNSDFNV